MSAYRGQTASVILDAKARRADRIIRTPRARRGADTGNHSGENKNLCADCSPPRRPEMIYYSHCEEDG